MSNAPPEAGDNQPPYRKPGLIFVSYRVTPDTPLAAALKKLIETSIDPTPEVFVSGVGGLRPSRIGFKQQIQDAARKAVAFVSLITNASKDREWIYFEAGAAWGQDLFYCPVLIGTQPRDLPSSIGDYQAMHGQTKEQMSQLIEELAVVTGGVAKDRFNLRFQGFRRTVEEYLEGISAATEPITEGEDDLGRAMQLAEEGKIEASNELFDQLEAAAGDDRERVCQVRACRLRAKTSTRITVDLFTPLRPEFENTSFLQYFLGVFTDQPEQKARHLRRAVEIGGRLATRARLDEARHDIRRGHQTHGTQSLFTLMRDHPRTEFSEMAAVEVTRTWPDAHPVDHLTVLFAGLSGDRVEGYREITKVAEANEWDALRLYSAYRANELDDSGISANDYGRALMGVDLTSLAYEAYAEAAGKGVSVAKYNMASCLASGGVPSAGLKVLKDHGGEFYSADPGAAYALRGDLERDRHKEEGERDVLLKLGREQFDALWVVAVRGLEAECRQHATGEGRLASGHTVVTLVGGHIPTVCWQDQTTEPTPVKPFGPSLYRASIGDAIILWSVGNADAHGVIFANFAKGTGREWLAWHGASLERPALTSLVQAHPSITEDSKPPVTM